MVDTQRNSRGPAADLPVGIISRDAALRDDLVERLADAGFSARILPHTESSLRARLRALIIDLDGGDVLPDTLAASARWANPGVSVVALGTDPDPDALIRLMRAGCADFMEKPVEAASVAGRVRKIVERASMERFGTSVMRRMRGQRDAGEAEAVAEEPDLQSVNEKLHKAVSQIKTLYQMGRDLADNENWSDALDRFLMALVNFMEADGAALLLFSHYESTLRPRSTFQIDGKLLESACETILGSWKTHPRSMEVHPLESYAQQRPSACLERTESWKVTVIPLRHRNRTLGFLLLEKAYANGFDFKEDYDFLSSLQTIFVEELANASYISELRRLGRFNNKVLDNIRSGVITTDVDGLVRYYNVWASDMCPRLNDLKRKDAEPIHFDAIFTSRQFPEHFFEQIMSSAHGSYVLEVDCHGQGPDPFPVRLRATKMYDDNLNAIVLVAIFEDLTAQKRMEAEIRRNDRLRVLGQLSASVAHEIRNPLTGIANCAEVLSARLGNDEDKKKYTQAMLDEIRRLDGIIRNLLDFARPPHPRITPCRVFDVVDRVGELLSEQAAARGVRLDIDGVDRSLECHADPALLTQVLLNLAVNAIQACGDGDEVRIEALSTSLASGARVAHIEVIDSGPGIPETVRESLFEPFVTTKTRGTGLGLAISQQIVEEHHGALSCDFLERGTRFSIDLPQLPGTTQKRAAKAASTTK